MFQAGVREYGEICWDPGYQPRDTDVLARRLVVGIEYTSAPDPRDHYWSMWQLPLFDTDDPAVVLTELEACRQANPAAYIKVNGYDPARQGQVVSFVAAEPGPVT